MKLKRLINQTKATIKTIPSEIMRSKKALYSNLWAALASVIVLFPVFLAIVNLFQISSPVFWYAYIPYLAMAIIMPLFSGLVTTFNYLFLKYDYSDNEILASLKAKQLFLSGLFEIGPWIAFFIVIVASIVINCNLY